MADKTFSQLTGASSLAAADIFAIENGAGNSRKITATRVRNFMTSVLSGQLTAHISDTEAHGISTYFATLLASDNAEELLDLLGFELTGSGSSGKFSLGGLFVVTWRDHSISANASEAKDYGSDHTFTTFGKAWSSGDDSDGQDVSVWVTSSGVSSATVRNDGNSSASITLFAWGV